MKKWESAKHRSWSMQVDVFRGHVATDGSLLGKTGKWRACGWAVVQLDYDEEIGPLYGMYGSMEAELEVQRTIKRADLTACVCLLKRVIGPIKVHVDNKGDYCWITKRMHGLAERGILVEVEHVKAHRTKKDKKTMSQFEKFVTEGNEKADELAMAGAMLDEGFMAEVTAETMQQERGEVYAALQYAAGFHCVVEEWKDCEELRPKPKEKWVFVKKRRGIM